MPQLLVIILESMLHLERPNFGMMMLLLLQLIQQLEYQVLDLQKDYISSASWVHIATDAPNTVLHIKSTQNSDGLTVAKESTVSAFLGHNGTGTEGLLTLKEGGTTRVQLCMKTGQTSYIINSGNLGIGTVTPEYKTTIAAGGTNAKLNIKGKTPAASNGNAFGSLFYTNGAGTDVASVRP